MRQESTRARPARLSAFSAPAAAAAWMVLAIALLAPLSARAQAGDLPHVVVDRAGGEVLSHNRAFDRWYPASLTKLMTAYVALRAIAAGELAAGSPVTMSARAAKEPPSKTGWPAGTQVRVDTALRILIVKSANDVSVALAESVAGTVEQFVDRMNGEAQRLGMTDTRFANPNGLHSPQQHTNARDMAVLARQILAEFPQTAEWFATAAISEGGKADYSYNLLLERFAGADGMKTGFVCASGYNIVASATRGGRQLVAVLFGASSQTERAVEAARLLVENFPKGGGEPLAAFVRTGAPVEPKSQRASICSEEARRSRVDLQPQDMRIDSPLLSPRTPAVPVEIARGGIDAPPSEAALRAKAGKGVRIPVPQPRPDYVRLDVDGEAVPPGAAIRGAIPVPAPDPRQ